MTEISGLSIWHEAINLIMQSCVLSHPLLDNRLLTGVLERVAVVFVFINFVSSAKDDFKSSVGGVNTTCTFCKIFDGKFE